MLKPYEWMIKYTPQLEWLNGRGIYIWLAMYTGGLSSGLYLTSLYFNNLLGMFVGLLISLLMGLFYILHLRKPERFWRLLLRPQTSWISRGLICVILFFIFGAIGIILSYWYSGGVWEMLLKIIAGIFAFGQLLYTGFVISYTRAIKFWNSAIVPIISVVCSLLGGLAILLLIMLGNDYAEIIILKQIIFILLVIYAIFIAIFLYNTTYGELAAKESVKKIVWGDGAVTFWIGEILIGLLVPISILIANYFTGEISAVLLITVAFCLIIGGLSFRRSLFEGGIYTPLLFQKLEE